MINYIFTTLDDGNLAYHVNDDKKNIAQNRQNLKHKYNIPIENLKFMNQTHGCNIKVVTDNSQECMDDCDAIITNTLNLPLMVMVADCIPILMYDDKRNVIAAIHAGRNGTFLNIASKTAIFMREHFNCNVENIKVVLGPSIQKCCYEVSSELEEIAKKSFGKEFTNNRLIDLQGINTKQLLDIGFKSENIETSTICTKCSGEKYFSYRIDSRCGRFAGIISLN